MEAQRLITVSLGKIASSRCQRGGINLHRNLLVASVLHKARTAYMMDAYQHIIASRKQKQEVSESPCEKNEVVMCAKPESEVSDAGSQSSAMTHTQAISHAGEDKENSPPTAQANCPDKGAVMQGVENTITQSDRTIPEENVQGPMECKSTTLCLCENAGSTTTNCSNCGDSALQISPQNRPSCAVTCSTGKRRRSRNIDSSEFSSDSVLSPKKAKLDIPQKSEQSSEKENVENSSEILRDCNSCSSVSSSNPEDSAGVTCNVMKSTCSDRSEPMQTESTQITSLVTIFNSGFSGLCSRNTSSDSNSNTQSQPLSCATELKHESVQIPSGIALTV